MAEFIDSEILIYEVQKRPSIWDCRSKDYNDKMKKSREWLEISKVFFGEIEEVECTEQLERVTNLQTRWRSLRQCFVREYKFLKGKSRDAVRQRKKYVYFDKLSFLEEILEYRNAPLNVSGPKAEDEKEIISSDETLKQSTRKQESVPKPVQYTKNPSTFEEELLKILSRNSEHRKEDSDRHFLLSLLDDFKKIPEENKFRVKIEILSAIERGKNAANLPSFYPSFVPVQPMSSQVNYFQPHLNMDYSRTQSTSSP